jgi:DNA-binding response OmpR family regulator
MAEILVVEDNKAYREALVDMLTDEGYSVRTAGNGLQALDMFAEKKPSLVLLDVMMPGRDGYAVCTEMRAKDPLVPILMLTAKNAEDDRVRGLQRGADDYIDKTVGTREILARVETALRRAGAIAASMPEQPASSLGASFMIGSHRVDGVRLRLISARGREQAIAPREVKILRYLVEHAEESVSREALIDYLWDGEYAGTTRSIDQAIWRIREKLGADGRKIATMHGAGYSYRP